MYMLSNYLSSFTDILIVKPYLQGFPGGASGQKTSETQVRSLDQEDPLEEGHGNPLQYSCLENPMAQGAW